MLRRPPRSTLFSLHDALPISRGRTRWPRTRRGRTTARRLAQPHPREPATLEDRKSTRLNSSHMSISYAVFCLKKKKKKKKKSELPDVERDNAKSSETQERRIE